LAKKSHHFLCGFIPNSHFDTPQWRILYRNTAIESAQNPQQWLVQQTTLYSQPLIIFYGKRSDRENEKPTSSLCSFHDCSFAKLVKIMV
jgi:hypothetical protein